MCRLQFPPEPDRLREFACRAKSLTLASVLRKEDVVFTLRHGRLRFAPHLHVSTTQMQALATRIVSFAATHEPRG